MVDVEEQPNRTYCKCKSACNTKKSGSSRGCFCRTADLPCVPTQCKCGTSRKPCAKTVRFHCCFSKLICYHPLYLVCLGWKSRYYETFISPLFFQISVVAPREQLPTSSLERQWRDIENTRQDIGSRDSLADEREYLDNVFSKNNYNRDFVRRNTYRAQPNVTNTNATPVTTATIPYIKRTSETIARILQPYNIRVAHKPIAEHHLQTNHRIDWDSAECVTYSTNYYQRIVLESWFSNLEQTPLNINRCLQLPAPYKRLVDDINNRQTTDWPTTTHGSKRTNHCLQQTNNRPTNFTNNTRTDIRLTKDGSKRTSHCVQSSQPMTTRLNWQSTNNITTSLTNHINGQSIYTTHWRHTNHLTLTMTSAQVVETLVNVTLNSPSQDYTHPDDRTPLSYDMTPGFKSFTSILYIYWYNWSERMPLAVTNDKVVQVCVAELCLPCCPQTGPCKVWNF